MHMDYFNQLSKNCSNYRSVESRQLFFPDHIKPILKNMGHIQILFSTNNHCVVIIIEKNLFIYDSLNLKKWHNNHEKFLRRLFPTYPFDKRSNFLSKSTEL